MLFSNDEGGYDAVEELHYHIYVPDSYDRTIHCSASCKFEMGWLFEER